MSVSLKKATNKTNIKHNNRTMNEKEKERNSHIDSSKSHENKYLVQEDLKEIYDREFSQALEKYNDKQKRSDRKINNYFKHIEASKKTSTQQEMIIQVGDKDDFSNNENGEIANAILEEWFQDFEERNPNLKVYNAVIHNDEASPHLHLNFVPIAEGYKRGLEKQVAFDRAIIQQDPELNKTRPFEDWREKEVSLLEEKLLEHGIERKLVGTNEYKDVNEYKEKRELEREVLQLEQKLSEKKNELLAYSDQVPIKVDASAKREMKKVEVPTGENNIFGKPKMKIEKKPTENVILSEVDYKKLVTAARANEKLKTHLKNVLNTDMAKENRELRKKNEVGKNKYNDLVDRFNSNARDYNKLLEENRSLKDRIKDLTNEIGSIYKGAKEFLKERTDGLKAFRSVFNDLVSKVKEKAPKGEFEHLNKVENRRERDNGLEL